jgi:predicted RNA binding protein YcfA (HicA-like mRNA interferase family)
MEFYRIKQILDERKLTPEELKKREEIAQAIERDNPGMDMSKKMAIATAQAKKCCKEDIESLTEVSMYDLVVTYYRHLGLDPYKLRGKQGSVLRDKVKNSPSFHAWLKANRYESVDIDSDDCLSEATQKSSDVMKQLKKWGFDHISTEGSHHKFTLKGVSGHVSVPHHGTNKDLPIGTYKQIFKNAQSLLRQKELVKEQAEKIINTKKKKAKIEFYGYPSLKVSKDQNLKSDSE